MVSFLIPDVFQHAIQKRHAHSKRAIFDLPCKELVFRECIMNLFRRAALDELECFGNGKGGGQGQQDMYVIGHTANFDRLHSALPGDAAKEGPQSFA
jgi:hypothetical protein